VHIKAVVAGVVTSQIETILPGSTVRILIIGCGRMGRGIAMRAAAGKHELVVFDIDSAAAEQLASDLGGMRPDGARIAVAETPADAVPQSDLVILAGAYAVNLEVARELGTEVDGKVVVDISNPLNAMYDGLVTPPGMSAAEWIRDALPKRAHVVKAFNTTFAATLIAGEVSGQILDVFIAGDDQQAKNTVATLVRDGGLNPIDVGALDRARQLEALGLLGITLQARLGTQFGTAWKLIMPVKR
jgi:8-hydroxy-5-deazaflavin:NADPH oxidoreductase